MPKDMKGVMDEYKHGELHSGSKKGPVVKDRQQAIAIGLSEQRQMAKHHQSGAVSPPPPEKTNPMHHQVGAVKK